MISVDWLFLNHDFPRVNLYLGVRVKHLVAAEGIKMISDRFQREVRVPMVFIVWLSGLLAMSAINLFIWKIENQPPTRFEDAEPFLQHRAGVFEILQQVGGKNEIEAVITKPEKVLRPPSELDGFLSDIRIGLGKVHADGMVRDGVAPETEI
ncbi:MAG: hypothetical protein AAF514_17025 [Verrucomicrobiota bacterium]